MFNHQVFSVYGILTIVFFMVGCEVRVPFVEEMQNKHQQKNLAPNTVVTNTVNETPTVIQKAQSIEAKRQDTQWTSENIQKEPVLYLQSAIRECETISQKLETQLLALNIKKNQASREGLGQSKEGVLYQKFLDEVKNKYREADKRGIWPTEINGVFLTEMQLKNKIVEAYNKIEVCKKLANVHQNNVRKIEKKLVEINDRQQEIMDLKRKLSLDLEVAKVKKSIDDIDGIKDKVDAMQDISNALVSNNGDPTLEELVVTPLSEKVSAEFNKIMMEQ